LPLSPAAGDGAPSGESGAFYLNSIDAHRGSKRPMGNRNDPHPGQTDG